MIWGNVRPQGAVSAPEPATGATNAPGVDAGATEPLLCAQPNCGHRMQDHTDRALFGPGCAPPIQHGTASYATGRCGCPGWRTSEGESA